jgi:hypothetical protein
MDSIFPASEILLLNQPFGGDLDSTWTVQQEPPSLAPIKAVEYLEGARPRAVTTSA